MIKGPDDAAFNFDDPPEHGSIHAAILRWRESERAASALRRAAEASPGLWARFLFQTSVEERRLAARYLRGRFSFDANRGRFRGDPDITVDDWPRFLEWIRQYLGDHVLIVGMTAAIAAAHRRGDDPDLAAVKAFFEIEADYPWLAGLDICWSLPSADRDDLLAELSAWAATKISTRRNRRLRAALGEGSPHEVYRALLERLPAAVLEAAYHITPDEPPRMLRAQATNLIEGGGQRRRKRSLLRAAAVGPPTYEATLDVVWDARGFRKPSEPDPAESPRVLSPLSLREGARVRESLVSPESLEALEGRPQDRGSPQEAFVLAWSGREEIYELLRSGAGLSPRQLEVYLLREGEKLKYREIAEELEIRGGSIGPTLTRARRKIEAWRAAV